MTEDSLAKLTHRTDASHREYSPLSLIQKAALRAFVGGMEKADQNPASHARNIATLVKQGLGSDILYLACAYNAPNLATAIAREDLAANPLATGEDGFTTLDVVRERAKNDMNFQPLLALLETRAGHLEAATHTPAVTQEETVASVAPAEQPTSAATPADDNRFSIVARAKAGAAAMRIQSSQKPVPRLSDLAQRVLDDANPTKRGGLT